MNRLTCAQLRKQAMSVSLEPALVHTLAKPKHPLDDLHGMSDPGPHFGLGTIFRRLDLIDKVAAIDKIRLLVRAPRLRQP
jgi:hypothetical protein